MGRTLTFNRDEALQKAMHLFWEHGYQGASLKMLEYTLKIRPGSLYYSFGSKDQLYIEALDLYAHELIHELDLAISHHGNLIDGLKCFISDLVIVSRRSRPARACLIVKTLLELSSRGGIITHKADSLLQAMEDHFARLFEAAKSQGEIMAQADSRSLARQLQVRIIGIRGFAQRDNIQDQLPLIINDAIDGLMIHH